MIEKALVGALLLDPSNIDTVISILGDGKGAFTSEAGKVYEAMFQMHHTGMPLDMVSISDYLRRKDEDIDLNTFFTGDVVATHANHYARRVLDAYTLKQIVELCTQVINMSYQDGNDVSAIMNVLEKGIEAIQQHRPSAVKPMSQTAAELAHLLLNPGVKRSYSTGVVNLDHIIGSQFEPGRLITIAGRPGTGKTHSLVALTMALVQQKVPVLFFSLEMSDIQLLTRIIAHITKIDSRAIQERRLSAEQMEQVQRELAMFIDGHYPLSISTGVRDMTEMQANIRQTNMAMRRNGSPLGAVIVDYVQLVPPAQTQRRRDLEIGDVTRTLKLLALENNLAIIAASQLNREIERRQDKKPILSDLRESGSIEQDSDIVVFTYPELEYGGDAKGFKNGWEPFQFIVAKNRDGKTGSARCAYEKSTGTFMSLEGK